MQRRNFRGNQIRRDNQPRYELNENGGLRRDGRRRNRTPKRRHNIQVQVPRDVQYDWMTNYLPREKTYKPFCPERLRQNPLHIEYDGPDREDFSMQAKINPVNTRVLRGRWSREDEIPDLRLNNLTGNGYKTEYFAEIGEEAFNLAKQAFKIAGVEMSDEDLLATLTQAMIQTETFKVPHMPIDERFWQRD